MRGMVPAAKGENRRRRLDLLAVGNVHASREWPPDDVDALLYPDPKRAFEGDPFHHAHPPAWSDPAPS